MKPVILAAALGATLALAGPVARAAERSAASAAELATALHASAPGDTIYLAPGTWRDAALLLDRGGTAGTPLTIRAREPGRTILSGASSLTFAAPHLVVDGLLFTEGALKRDSVVTFRSHHGRLTHTAIVAYNPTDVATKYYWVYFEGDDNRLDHCFFTGKSNDQPVVGNAIKDSRRNTTDHCYFKDIPYLPNRNGREIFRLWGYGGNEELGTDGAFFTVEDNLFDRADGEGMEIVSLKSNRNTVRRNTIVATRGGITNRSGNFNVIEENLLLCNGAPGAYGMRITGQHHRIVNNRVERGEFGVHLMAGEFIASDLTGQYKPIERAGTPLGRVPAYNQPLHTLVAHNTFVDLTGVDLLLGNGYKSAWPRAQRVLLPEQNQIADNLIIKSKGGTAIDRPKQDTVAPLDRFIFAPNEFSGNVVLGGTVALDPAPAGIAVLAATAKPAATAGVAVPLRQLTPADVGPAWVIARRAASDARFP